MLDKLVQLLNVGGYTSHQNNNFLISFLRIIIVQVVFLFLSTQLALIPHNIHMHAQNIFVSISSSCLTL